MATSLPAPQLLARGPWAPAQVEARWRDEQYERPGREGRSRRRRRSRHCASAARRATTASPRGSSRHRERGRPADHGAPAGPLGAAPRRGRRQRIGRRAVRHARRRGPLARRAPRAVAGSWAGRWALGAGGAVDVGEIPADTLARELRRGVERRARAAAREALVRLPHRLVMFVGTGVAARTAPRSSATPSTTRTRGGRPTSRSGPTRPTSRCGAWPPCWRHRRDHVRRASSGRRSRTRRSTSILLTVWLVPGLHTLGIRLRARPRTRLDRDVAGLPVRGAPARVISLRHRARRRP